MNDPIKTFSHVNDLFAKYGDLLTPSQKNIMQSYYEYNLSLSEIGENMGISRPGVSDAIKKSTAKLEKLESKLHLVAKDKKIAALLSKIEHAEKDQKENLYHQLTELLNHGI